MASAAQAAQDRAAQGQRDSDVLQEFDGNGGGGLYEWTEKTLAVQRACTEWAGMSVRLWMRAASLAMGRRD